MSEVSTSAAEDLKEFPGEVPKEDLGTTKVINDYEIVC